MLQNAYIILGFNFNQTVSDEDVRKAYLDAIRCCPPEKDADAFQRIQSAYETIKTQRHRQEYHLFNYHPPTPEDMLAQAVRQTAGSTKRPNLRTIQALLLCGPNEKTH